MTVKKRPAVIADHSTELALGVALFLASTWLIWDAYEGRGRKRPFMARLLP